MAEKEQLVHMIVTCDSDESTRSNNKQPPSLVLAFQSRHNAWLSSRCVQRLSLFKWQRSVGTVMDGGWVPTRFEQQL